MSREICLVCREVVDEQGCGCSREGYNTDNSTSTPPEKDWKAEYEKLRETYNYLLKKQKRPSNVVAIPCDQLAEMQAKLQEMENPPKTYEEYMASGIVDKMWEAGFIAGKMQEIKRSIERRMEGGWF